MNRWATVIVFAFGSGGPSGLRYRSLAGTGTGQYAGGKLREKYIDLTVKGLKNAVNPGAPDYLVFGEPSQPLVDAAFLAQGLLRAPKQLWGNLDPQAKEWMITELKRSRNIKPFESNWLLFASTVEAALLEFTGECDMERMLYGVKKFRDEWYKGDAMYGDGVDFHMDYYNSFVIHPMLTDVLVVMKKHGIEGADFLDTQLKRHARLPRYWNVLFLPKDLSRLSAVPSAIVSVLPCVRTGGFDAYFARTGETGAGSLCFNFRHPSSVGVSGKFR